MRQRRLAWWGLAAVFGVLAWLVWSVETGTPDDELLTFLAVACHGSPVAEAAAYLPEGEPPFNVVLVREDGHRHEFTNALSTYWPASSVSAVALVACAGEEPTLRVIEVCEYSDLREQDAPDVTRYVEVQALTVFAARTGTVVGESEVMGSLPRNCRSREALDLTELKGGELTRGDFIDTLRPYAEGSRS